MAGCGLFGGGEQDPPVMTEPPSIGSGAMGGPVPMPGPVETPSVTGIEEITGMEGQVAVMRTPMADGGYHIGIAASCEEQGAVITVSMGPFPADYRPVQLAVRTVEGDTERVGPVLQLGIEHGFHSPRLEEESEIDRFLGAALQPGALVSNGFYSFFNRAGEAAAAAFREVVAGCGE